MKLVKEETTQKKPAAAKRKLNESAGTAVNIKAAVLITIGVILTIIVCALVAFDQLYQPVLLTINGDKYRLNDVRYYIFSQEYQGFQNESIYQNYMNSSFWDQVVDEETGKTNLDQSKEQTLSNIIRTEVLYKEAVKQGYSINDEDKEEAENNLSSMKENVSSSIIKNNGFSDSYLRKVLQKVALISRFQQDTVDSFDIDDDAIKEGIDYEDYHQYEIGVFSVRKTTIDENNETKELSKKELKEAYDKLEALKDTVKASEELDKVLSEEEETVTYTSEKITEDSTTYGKKNVKKIIKMENGDMMDIIETDDAYYLIKMINNKATESYDSAVSSAISTEENSQFETYYTDLQKEYTIKESEEEWEDLNFGYITMDAYTGQ